MGENERKGDKLECDRTLPKGHPTDDGLAISVSRDRILAIIVVTVTSSMRVMDFRAKINTLTNSSCCRVEIFRLKKKQ